MSQIINTGSAPNDGTGDLLRNAFIKINQNFADIDIAITDLSNVNVVQTTDISTIKLQIIDIYDQLTAIPDIQIDINAINDTIIIIDSLLDSHTLNLSDLNATVIDLQNQINAGGGGGGVAGVPYVGATSSLNLGEFGLLTGNVQFDNTPINTPTAPGSLLWNDTDGTLDLKLKGGNVTLQLGQEQVIRVVNKTATNITLQEAAYQAVRVTGAQGQRLKVDLAQATNDILSAETIGLVTETILNNHEGFVTTSGLVRGINTTGSLQGETWVDGQILYLSAAVAGRITSIKPAAPNHLIVIGYVISAHVTQGTIFVKVNNGYELDELHNVTIATPLNNQILTYEFATELWKNKSVNSAIGYTPADDSTVVHKTGNETIQDTKTINSSTGKLILNCDNSISPPLEINIDEESAAVQIINNLNTTNSINYASNYDNLYNGSFVPGTFINANIFSIDNSFDYSVFSVSNSGAVIANNITGNTITGSSFIKNGGASNEYLMADGSISTGGFTAIPWVDISLTSTINGFTTFNQRTIRYQKIGRLLIVNYHIDGNGNGAVAPSFTIPFYTTDTTGFISNANNYSRNNNTPYMGIASISALSNIVTFQFFNTGASFGTWSNTTNRLVRGTIVIELDS